MYKESHAIEVMIATGTHDDLQSNAYIQKGGWFTPREGELWGQAEATALFNCLNGW